jgi:hypothetical protein
MKWIPTGKPVVPLKYPSSPSASIFALRATPRQDTVVIRLICGVTSRRSNQPMFLAFIHGQARGILRRRIKSANRLLSNAILTWLDCV